MSSDWQKLTLDDVCVKITDGAHASPKSVEIGMPMASVKDLTHFGLDLSEARHISIKDYDKLVDQGCKPEVGDVIIAKDGNSALDTVCTIEKSIDTVLLSSVAILRPDNEVLDSGFLKYYFSSKDTIHYLKSNFISGAAIPRIVLRDFRKAEIKLPPLKTQKEIASVLKSLDQKIHLNRQTNETLEAMAQAIFKSWFVDFDPVRAKIEATSAGRDSNRAAMAAIAGVSSFAKASEDRQVWDAIEAALQQKLGSMSDEQRTQLRQTAELFPDELMETEIGEVPKGWSVKSFIEICEDVQSGGTPKRSESEYWGEGYPWLSSGEIRNKYLLKSEEQITERGLTESNAKLWPSGSTIIAMYGATAGVTAYLANEMCANQACCCLIPADNSVFIFISALRASRELSGKSTGSAQQNLNKGIIENHKTLMPSNEIIEDFESIASPLIEKIIQNEKENKELSELRDTLLPKLISGKLSVS